MVPSNCWQLPPRFFKTFPACFFITSRVGLFLLRKLEATVCFISSSASPQPPPPAILPRNCFFPRSSFPSAKSRVSLYYRPVLSATRVFPLTLLVRRRPVHVPSTRHSRPHLGFLILHPLEDVAYCLCGLHPPLLRCCCSLSTAPCLDADPFHFFPVVKNVLPFGALPSLNASF